MKTKLLLLIALCFFACKEQKVEPKQKTQEEITYPIVDAIYVQDNLYIILPDGLQYISFYNNKYEYTFFYYSTKIDFKARREGDEVIVSYKGVDIKCKREFKNK